MFGMNVSKRSESVHTKTSSTTSLVRQKASRSLCTSSHQPSHRFSIDYEDHSQNIHSQYVRTQLEAREEHDRLGHIRHVHHRFRLHAPIGLAGQLPRLPAHRGRGVTDVDLGAADGVFASVERGGFGEAEDGVFRDGVRGGVFRSSDVRSCLMNLLEIVEKRRLTWAGGTGGDTAVVDDAAALWGLVFHEPDGCFGALGSTSE